MLNYYTIRNHVLCHANKEEVCLPGLVWVDLWEPTREEEKTAEELFHINIPTKEEMQEIEMSSRLYQKNGALYATATVVTKADTPEPETHAITFILINNCLITIRYVDPNPFKAFLLHSQDGEVASRTGGEVFIGLLEAIVDRVADILEMATRNIDSTTRQIFRPKSQTAIPVKPDFEAALQQIGVIGDLISRTRESLVSVNRLLIFIMQSPHFDGESVEYHRLNTVIRDIVPLSDHASFLANKVSFLLDATLGMISNQQNAIIKIFSVAAVVFLPPTLIASIYGMNFDFMPELKWHFGYPMALCLMALSSYLPYKFFKSKGWL